MEVGKTSPSDPSGKVQGTAPTADGLKGCSSTDHQAWFKQKSSQKFEIEKWGEKKPLSYLDIKSENPMDLYRKKDTVRNYELFCNDLAFSVFYIHGILFSHQCTGTSNVSCFTVSYCGSTMECKKTE